jgi:hypothetical protein
LHVICRALRWVSARRQRGSISRERLTSPAWIKACNSPQRLGIGCSKATALAASKKLSIKEFLLEHPPTTDIQRTLAVGYFLETHGGMTSFTKAELEKGYRDAKEPMPSNIGVNIKHCIRHAI